MTSSTEIEETCREEGIELVRLLFADNAGVLRGRVIPADRVASAIDQGVTCPANVLSMDFSDGLARDGEFGVDGELALFPDTGTFRVLPYAERTAVMLCDLRAVDGTPMDGCPRTTLRSYLDDAEFELRSAFESEFYLLRAVDGETELFEESPLFSADGMQETAGFTRSLADALRQQGMNMEAYYPEGGPGQQEFVIEHARNVTAADEHLLKRQTTKAVAAEHGYDATFAPLVSPSAPPSGMHVNVSLLRGGENAFYEESSDDGHDVSDTLRHFVGGILEHAPALTAVTAPTTLSYHRFRLHDLSPGHATWGFGDRRCMVRVPETTEESATRIEYRAADNTVNPYVALTGLLAAGLDGVDRELDPGRPYRPDDDGGTRDREPRSLPRELGEAISALEEDQVLRDALGERAFSSLVAVERLHQEEQRTESVSAEEIDRFTDVY